MKKKNRLSTFILVLVFLAGLSLLLYPSVSNYWNSFHQTRAITSYVDQVAELDSEEYDRMLKEAREYNKRLSKRSVGSALSEEQKDDYDSCLNIGGSGVMGYIEIPQISVDLPIYHGTDDTVLSVGVGHLEWTSLPVGGISSHCVLSGHRGLPSSRLFTDLDRIVEGDIFVIRILNEVFTYEVDQILIVDPHDTEALEIVEGKDYCTLVTCTPYGINTHRLLVRGHRIENAEDDALGRITSEAIQIEPAIVAAIVGVPLLVLMLIVVLLFGGNKGSKRGGKVK